MITVIPVADSKSRRDFLNLPYRLYADQKNWIPPLKMERRDFINPKKNPFFKNADVQLFVAYDNDRPVARLSAHINHLHNQRYSEQTAHFGLFESENHLQAAREIFSAAEKWARSKNMTAFNGPFSFSTNEETGLLIDGFEHKPFPFMAYNLPYYPELLENIGFTKLKDLIAWGYDSTRPVPEVAEQIADAVRAYPGLVVRQLNPKKIKEEVRLISDVFNSAWSKNWGFVPWTEDELEKMAVDFKMILEPKLALIAEVNGVPAAISIAIPNYHEAIADLGGNLFPLGLPKLIYRLKTGKIKSARLALLGIKKEFRHDVLAGLSVLLYAEMHRRSRELGHTGGELSWTLEDNHKINHGIELMGGYPEKKYRIYGKTLIK